MARHYNGPPPPLRRGCRPVPLSPTTRAYLQVHLCVILWGFTPIFGRLIHLEALALVWWRMLIVVVALLLLSRVRRQLLNMPLRLLGAYAGIGLLVAMHWLLFYAAVKLANASVGAICIAVAPGFGGAHVCTSVTFRPRMPSAAPRRHAPSIRRTGGR